MKLENQVTNLELSKKLKELGVKQESLFYWIFNEFEREHILVDKERTRVDHNNTTAYGYPVYSAFTVAELGEMLPKGYYSLLTKEDGWVCFPKTKGAYAPGVLVQATWAEAEANARAKMLIYLIENGLLNKQWTRNK